MTEGPQPPDWLLRIALVIVAALNLAFTYRNGGG